MSATHQLAEAIIRTVTGPMWHGPALGELLKGMTHEQASARPLPSAHSVWELVLHIRTWAEVPRARLAGQPRRDVQPEEDWPRPAAATAAAWREAVEGMESAYRSLARAVAELDDSALDGKVVGHDYTVRSMLHGVIEHGTYHGGQIALLKKAAG